MIPLRPQPGGRRPLRVLCIGAHADDIEIGAGGTVLTLAARQPLAVTWLVLSADGERDAEARRSARAFLSRSRSQRLRLFRYRDGYFPAHWQAIKESFEGVKREAQFDLVLTHARDDLHQDHRLCNELTWNTFRDHLILEYEIPKFDGDLGRPNVYQPLTRAAAARKVRLLLRHFASQRSKRWFTADLFWALMRLRGVESNAPSGFAEAFHGRKLVL
ncbi:MAG TPA: PIG-L deacetylase family protein [Steroidobacteraceae bacterium]|nr:PIG-L deacetylase family protein [Steroidobacteraceae bacterium]